MTTQRVTATVLGLGLIMAPVPCGAQERVVASGAKVEKLAGNFEFTEGPVWTADGRYLVFTSTEGASNGIATQGGIGTTMELWVLALRDRDR